MLILLGEEGITIKTKIGNFISIIFMAAFILVFCYMLFANLDRGYLIQTDEAYHATNAYEMFTMDNWIVNTYRGAVDYFNSKPPLCLDLMIISYKIFGVSGFAARFPSAMGGLITLIIINLFLLRKKGLYSAAIFSVIFCGCTDFFTFHMYRAAEMDSIYNLFFALAMISLYMMQEKMNFMYLYGISLGLAFMCKGPHAALIFIIGLLFIPKIKKAFGSVKRVGASVLLAIIIPGAWMIKRYMFDGFELFNALFLGEVADRVSGSQSMTVEPVFDFVTSSTTIIFGVVLVVVIILGLIAGKKSGVHVNENIKEFLSDNYLFIIWAIVPVVFFAVTKSYLTWYTYTSQIALSILTANLAVFCMDKIGHEAVVSKLVLSAAAIAATLYFVVPCITYDINKAGIGGHPVDNFTEEMQTFYDTYGDEYSGVNAYLVPSFQIDKSKVGHWEPEYVAPAEMYVNLVPVEGTVDNFLSDPDSILILDKDLWEEYSELLAGHIILQDNSYLIFSTKMYGE